MIYCLKSIIIVVSNQITEICLHHQQLGDCRILKSLQDFQFSITCSIHKPYLLSLEVLTSLIECGLKTETSILESANRFFN